MDCFFLLLKKEVLTTTFSNTGDRVDNGETVDLKFEPTCYGSKNLRCYVYIYDIY